MTSETARKPGPPGSNPRLIFTSPKSTRSTLGRLIRARFDGRIERERYRDAIWGVQTLLSAWRLELDSEIEARVRALEEAQTDEAI